MLLPSDPSFRVTVRDLTKSYGDSLVLDHVSLDLESGCPCCLMAPSGAGKTTLFRILMGLETADSGTIEGLEGRSFSAVFQEDRLLEGYTALQNIRFVTGRGYPAHELTAIIKHLLPEDSLKKPVSEFSGGMKRRVAILRAILAPSEIILMDEPFTGLDEPVITFLEEDGEILRFLDHVYALVDASVKRYMERGFSNLSVCFGCTGGQHRSVYSAQHLAEHLNKKFGVKVELVHREQNIERTFEATI